MSRPSRNRPYLFGDNDRALERLQVLARVFRPTTESFLRRHRGRHPVDDEARILDLGCGPGRTTRLLADIFEQRVTGLDSSESLLWEARRLGPHRVSFLLFDVSANELPITSDLVFSRFLLSHLRDPTGRVRSWGRSLRAAGSLLSEEVEAIETDNRTFRRYLDLVERALERQGGKLYVGPEIGAQQSTPALELDDSQITRLDVTDVDAARMFSLNLPTLRQTREVREITDSDALETLQQELDEIAYSSSSDTSIAWQMRQTAWLAKA